MVHDDAVTKEFLERLRNYPMDGSFDAALHLAVAVHVGQTDKANAPYAHHAIRVGCAARAIGGDDAGIVGLLHDSKEDSKLVTDELLRWRGFTELHIEAINLLRRSPDQTLEAKISEILDLEEGSPVGDIVRIVKFCDTDDNSNIHRFANPTEHQRRRCEYYKQQRQRLFEYLHQHGLVL